MSYDKLPIIFPQFTISVSTTAGTGIVNAPEMKRHCAAASFLRGSFCFNNCSRWHYFGYTAHGEGRRLHIYSGTYPAPIILKYRTYHYVKLTISVRVMIQSLSEVVSSVFPPHVSYNLVIHRWRFVWWKRNPHYPDTKPVTIVVSFIVVYITNQILSKLSYAWKEGECF